MPLQTRLFGSSVDMYYPAGSEEIVTGDFIKKTEKMVIPMHYRHMLIHFEKLQSYVVEGRERRCQHGKKPCNGFGNCYSCPPLAPTLEKYNSLGYRNVLVYCFYADMEPFSQATRIYKYQNAERTLSPHIRKYGRTLEGLLNGKDISDGRCKKCHPCNASLEPRKPCVNYQELHCSLESLGIHVGNLSRDVLNHELRWWWHSETRKEDAPYITFVHGLLTNNMEPKKETVEPYYTKVD